jgi:hypothetical protein
MEVQLLQGAERVGEGVIIQEVLVLEVEFQQAAMAATEARRVEAVVVQGGPEITVLLEQAEQGAQVRRLQFLATMEEVPKPTVLVEMAEPILQHSLRLQLEQAEPQILVTEVEEEVLLLFRHPAVAALSVWGETADPVWSSFNIPHNDFGTHL